MGHFDSLEIFAEVGVALAGFSGVAAAIAGRSPAGLFPRQRIGFWMVLSGSLAVAVLALLPRAIANFDVSEPVVWRLVCLLAAGYFVLSGTWVWRYHKRLERSGHPSQFPQVYPIIGAVLTAATLALLLAGIGVLPGFAVYHAALVVGVAGAANAFILFLLVQPPE